MLVNKNRRKCSKNNKFSKEKERESERGEEGPRQAANLLLIPDVLSNGLNFVSLHGPLVSLRGLKKMIA